MSKLTFPAVARNRDPILAELAPRLAPDRLPSGLVLELASGSGEHAVHFARALPHLQWQPTDLDPPALASIAAWRAEAGLPNLRAPLPLDVTAPWPLERADAIFCANMIHISPWPATEALFAGAGRLLPAHGALFTYGPYRFGGVFTAPSNQAFDQSLRQRDPRWGVRDLDELRPLAAQHGLSLDENVAMPANNHLLVWRRAAGHTAGDAAT
jgi:Protein of unknown function (DUF938)